MTLLHRRGGHHQDVRRRTVKVGRRARGRARPGRTASPLAATYCAGLVRLPIQFQIWKRSRAHVPARLPRAHESSSRAATSLPGARRVDHLPRALTTTNAFQRTTLIVHKFKNTSTHVIHESFICVKSLSFLNGMEWKYCVGTT